MALSEETAFFRFDTNADQIATNIEAAMRRINASLLETTKGQHQNADDTAAFGGGFKALEDELRAGQGRITNLLGQLGSGKINRGEFESKYRESIRSTVGKIPTILGQELANMPSDVVAQRLNVKGIADSVAQEYVQALLQAGRASRGLAGDALKGFRFESRDFKDAVAGVGESPVDYFSTQLSGAQYLTNRRRIEELIGSVPATEYALAMKGQGGESAQPLRSQLHQLGALNYADEIFREQATLVTRKNKKGDETSELVFQYSDAVQRLREMNREASLNESTAHRQAREMNQAANAAERAAEAAERERIARERILRAQFPRVSTAENFNPMDEFQRVNGGYIDKHNGTPLTLRGDGIDEQTNVVRAAEIAADAEALAARQQNAARLLANLSQVQPVGGFNVLGGADVPREMREVYSVNRDGTEATLIQSEITRKRILDQQDAALASQLRKAEALTLLNERQTAKQELGQAGPLAGFLARFQKGETSFGTGIGGQIASATAFSFAYGALFGLQHAIRDTINEFVDYQDSVTDLQVAMGRGNTVTDEWVNNLSNLARISGSNVGATIDSATRGVRAFAEEGDSQAMKERVGSATARTATNLSLITNRPLTDATGDTIAIGTAFGLKDDQLSQVTDAVANARRTIGGDAAQVSQGLALIALSAQEAGFSLDETASVMSLVQARTDQSGQAIATRLTRIFQITQGSTGKSLAASLGVDPNMSAKSQIEAYAGIYTNPNTSEAVKDRITSALGGTANMRELLPLLKENERLQRAYKKALDNTGQGTDEINRKSGNFAGTLKKITADISYIQVNLAKSGLFDFFGAGVQVIEPALKGVNELLSLYQELTGMVPHLKQVSSVLIDILLVSKAIAVVKNAQGMVQGLVGTAETTIANGVAKGMAGGGAEAATTVALTDAANVARQREAALITEATAARAAAEAREVETINVATTARGTAEARGAAMAAGGGAAGAAGKVGVFGKAGGLATLGRFAMNPWVLLAGAAIGGLALFGKYKENEERLQQAQDSLRATEATYTRALGTSGSSADSLKQSAKDYFSTAGNLAKTEDSSIFGGREELDRLSATAMDRGKALSSLIEARMDEDTALTVKTKSYILAANGAVETNQQLTDSMKLMSDQGATAIDTFDALLKTLSTPPPDQIGFRPEAVKDDVVLALGEGMVKAIPKGATAFNMDWDLMERNIRMNAPLNTGATITDPKDIVDQGLVAGGMGKDQVDAISKAFDDQVAKLRLSPTDILTTAQQQKLATAVARAVSPGNLDKGSIDEFRSNVRQMVLDQLIQSAKPDRTGPLLNGRNVTKSQIYDLLVGTQGGEDGQNAQVPFMTSLQASLSAIPGSDDGTMAIRIQRDALRVLKMYQRRLARRGESLSELNLTIAQLEHQAAAAAVERLDDLRQAAESRTKSTAELRKVRLSFAKRLVHAAGDDPKLIEQIMESLDRATVKSVIASVQAEIKQAIVAQRHAAETVRITQQVVQFGIDGMDFVKSGVIVGEKGVKKADAKIKGLRALLKTLNKVYNTTANITDDTAENGKADELYAAKQQAIAARDGGQIAAATAAINIAKHDMAKYKKNSAKWFQALGALYQGQQEMSDALLSYHTSLAALEGDNTDPVEQARDALKIAREKLARDRAKGRGKDIIAADKADIKDKDAALQQTAFQQRLSDMQTAEQLGRISEATYLRYLQHEHDRLSRINHRTRQQQDQLNTIDQAIQEANNAMDAQFNFGSINVRGMVYQARRYAAEQAAQLKAHSDGLASQVRNAAASGQTVQQQVSIHINGADTAKVRRIVEETVGGATRTRTTQARRR